MNNQSASTRSDRRLAAAIWRSTLDAVAKAVGLIETMGWGRWGLHRMWDRNWIAYRLLVSIFAVSSFVTFAHADIALQANVDQRLSSAERAALERLKAALERHHVVTRSDQIVERFGPYLPLPGRPDRDVTRTTLIQRIDKAVNRAAHEAYDEAVAILEAVFRDLDANPALVASDPDSRTWVTKGRVALIYSSVRSKKGKLANDVTVDHIRSYPDLSLMGEQEEVEKAYNAGVPILNKTPRGKLRFRVDRPEAEIFVNGVARGKGNVEVALLPGDYRIVVRVGNVYRSYKTAIRGKETSERTIDWSTDAAFTVAPDWIGFDAAGASTRAVKTFAEQLAQHDPDEAIIVYGIVQRDGRRGLLATRYAAPPAQPRPDRVVEPDKATEAAIEALATYVSALDTEAAKPEPKVPVAPSRHEERAVVTRAPTEAPTAPYVLQRWPVLVATGVFATSVPLGAYLLKTHNDCYSSCSRLTVPSAWGLFGLGGAAATFGVFWIVHAGRASPASVPVVDVQLLPRGSMAFITGTF